MTVAAVVLVDLALQKTKEHSFQRTSLHNNNNKTKKKEIKNSQIKRH